MMYSILTLLTLASAAFTANAAGNITDVISTLGGVGFMCSGGQWKQFGLTMAVAVYINGAGPFIPMAEQGLPTIQLSWFINGAAAPATLTGAFGVGNVASSGNVVSFSLLDDQPDIGGTFSIGTCTQGQAVPTITVKTSSSVLVNGVGVAGMFPAVSAIPNVVNAFPAPFNGGSGTGGGVTVPATTAPVKTAAPVTTAPATIAPATVAPTVAATVAPVKATGNITDVITVQGGVFFMCSGGKWTQFGLSMSVAVFINGAGPFIPMAEQGLPTIQMSWFINGAAAPATFSGAFGVTPVVTTGNAVSFTLRDDQPSFGGTIAVGTCTQGQALPAITVSMTSTTSVTGAGVAGMFPAVTAVPHVVNGFPAANNAGSTFSGAAADVLQESSQSAAPSGLNPIALGAAIGAAVCAVGIAGIALRRHKQRKIQVPSGVEIQAAPNQSLGSIYVAQKD